MAEINPPSYLQAGSHSAIGDRFVTTALLQPRSGVNSTRSGVRIARDGTELGVTASGTPNNQVTVAAGMAFVAGTAGGDTYVCVNDANVTLTVAAASTTQSRKDLVVAQVYDTEQDVGAPGNYWVLRVVQGTPSSGTPTVPATPDRSVPLAELSIPAGVTTAVRPQDITDRRSHRIVALGGVTPVPSVASMPAFPYPGYVTYCLDVDEFRVWTGTAWRRFAATDALPDPVFDSTGIQHTPGADLSMRAFNPSASCSITLPRPAWCLMTLDAAIRLISSASTDILVQMHVTGATTWHGSPTGVWGNQAGLYAGAAGGYDGTQSHQHYSVAALLNAGTTTLTAHYETPNSSATTRLVISPQVQIIPLRFD